jgi:hypothetical protein
VRLSVVVLVLLAAGCGGPGRPETIPLTGRITYQGKPVPTGRIMFYPEQGRPATGTIEADGTYRLTTFVAGDGASLGRYRVTIQAIRVIRGGHAKTFDEEIRGGGTSGPGEVEWLVPEEYARQDSTPLRAEVTRDSKTINFDLPLPR